MGFIVIAAGGGGIPVYLEDDGRYEGVDGVVDKDRAAAVLGREIGAQELYILTAVDKVSLNFGTAKQQELDYVSVDEIKKYAAQGHFPAGSMGPKVEAAIEFIEGGGELVVITSINRMPEALQGKTATRIVP
jgi:carbamate kinase